jgi:hypothetical protein
LLLQERTEPVGEACVLVGGAWQVVQIAGDFGVLAHQAEDFFEAAETLCVETPFALQKLGAERVILGSTAKNRTDVLHGIFLEPVSQLHSPLAAVSSSPIQLPRCGLGNTEDPL